MGFIPEKKKHAEAKPESTDSGCSLLDFDAMSQESVDTANFGSFSKQPTATPTQLTHSGWFASRVDWRYVKLYAQFLQEGFLRKQVVRLKSVSWFHSAWGNQVATFIFLFEETHFF